MNDEEIQKKFEEMLDAGCPQEEIQREILEEMVRSGFVNQIVNSVSRRYRIIDQNDREDLQETFYLTVLSNDVFGRYKRNKGTVRQYFSRVVVWIAKNWCRSKIRQDQQVCILQRTAKPTY